MYRPDSGTKSCQTRPEFECFGDAVNHSQDTQSTVIRVFGRVGEAWRELTAKPCTLRGGEHAHIYVTIPAQWLSPAGWEAEKLEELALAAGTAAPGPGVQEKLVFCQA